MKKSDSKKANSKKRMARIRLVVFWIICIALIVWMLNLPRNKKTSTVEETKTSNHKSSSVTDLEKLKIDEYIKSLDFSEIAVLEDNMIFSGDVARKKMVYAQMEYLKYNPGAENDKEQIKSIYRKTFENVSDEVFSNAYDTEMYLAMDNRVENEKDVTNYEGNEVLTGLSVYAYVGYVEKESDGTYLVTVENVNQLNLSKIRSDHIEAGDSETLKTTYLNYVNDKNIEEYQYNTKTYQLRLAIDDGRLYVKDF